MINSLVLLVVMIIFLIVLICVARSMASSIRSKTPMEQKAIKKGFLTYLLTDSALFGWLVYNKNNPKNKL